jgi:hypothetical protein
MPHAAYNPSTFCSGKLIDVHDLSYLASLSFVIFVFLAKRPNLRM